MIWISSTILIVVEVLAIISAIHALFTVRTTQGTIAWVIGLLTFPWLALPFYWMFGCRQFHSYASAIQKAYTDHSETIAYAYRQMEPYQVDSEASLSKALAGMATLAERPYLRGDQLTLLIDGNATFEAIIDEIKKAQHHIYLLFYIMREDALGLRLLEALAEKAKEGVDVCFLVDSLGSFSMNARVREKWQLRGIRMATFCANSNLRDRWRLNFRNHRKIVVVDGKTGFIGGHNVGDEYLGLSEKYGRWRDTHVRIQGPTALQIQLLFAADWLFATGEKLETQWQVQSSSDTSPHWSLILPSGPTDTYERCGLFFLNAILMAKKRLWIASPYFVPDEGILAALKLAAIRGVEVRILIPKRADERLVWLASLALLKEMHHPHIHIHRYKGGFLHQKTLLVDDYFTAIGSANFDNRSFRLNFEVTLAVVSKEFTVEVAEMLSKDFEESIEVDQDDYNHRPLLVKTGAKIARLLAPIL